jgi:hypothetical protein
MLQIAVNLRIGKRNPPNDTSDEIVTARKLEKPSSFRQCLPGLYGDNALNVRFFQNIH